jgi:bifunctional UDP-N-acetylglucosamine pyrophosphorylase/glucosamine-1-phosphate N-acetyltransferase
MSDNNKIESLLRIAQKKEEEKLNINLKHMEAGVVFVDWKTAYIDDTVTIGSGTIIEPGVILKGKTVIGNDCIIGFNTKIVDSIIGDGVDIQSSVILISKVGNRTKIGPFAYLRPNSRIGDDAKVGDFVEIKNSSLGN